MARPQEAASIFDKIASATVSAPRDPRLSVGDYVLKVISLEEIDGFKGKSFVFRFEITSARQTDKEVSPNEAGSKCAYTWNVSTNPYAVNDIKSCLMAVTKQGALTGPEIRLCVDPKNPCEGALVRATVAPAFKVGATGKREPKLNSDGVQFINTTFSEA